jgi:hypothetical protein
VVLALDEVFVADDNAADLATAHGDIKAAPIPAQDAHTLIGATTHGRAVDDLDQVLLALGAIDGRKLEASRPIKAKTVEDLLALEERTQQPDLRGIKGSHRNLLRREPPTGRNR